MGEAEVRYWQAVKSDRDNHKRASDAALQRSDCFEFMGQEVERQATLLRLCQDARDEALRELFDPPRPGSAKRVREHRELWPKQVLSHETLLQFWLDRMGQMLIWKRMNDEFNDLHADD